MTRTSRLATVGLGLAVAAAAGIAAAAGVLLRGDGTVEMVTSGRGETYAMATSGVYAFNAQRVVAEGIGWDAFTLLVLVPATVIATIAVWRGSYRARLVLAGLFGYFGYMYLEYAITWAFGPLFLLFVAIYAASFAGIALVAVDLARDAPPVADAGFPRRAWPVLLGGMSGLLTVAWLGRVATGLTSGVDGLLLGETTMTVQALDLGFVVPVSVAVAVLAWRGQRWAAAVSAAYSVTFVAMSAAITSMLVSASVEAGVAEVPPLAMFGLATVLGAWLSVRIFRSLRPTEVAFRLTLELAGGHGAST